MFLLLLLLLLTVVTTASAAISATVVVPLSPLDLPLQLRYFFHNSIDRNFYEDDGYGVTCRRLPPLYKLSGRDPAVVTQHGSSAAAADRSKQLPALLSVECSVYRTLAWRSSGENASLFRALPLYSCYDAPSPLTGVRSSCQFNCGPFFFCLFVLLAITHSSWCPLSSPISSD